MVAVLWLCLLLLGACNPTASASSDGDLSVDQEALDLRGEPGETTLLTLGITNLRRVDRIVDLRATASWIDLVAGDRISMAAGTSANVALELTCESSGVVQHAWLLIETHASAKVIPIRQVCGSSPTVTDPEHGASGSVDGFSVGDPLHLEPPMLEAAKLVRIDAEQGPFVLDLDHDVDYLILMPDEPVRSGIVVSGGRHVVMVGGEIAIPWQGERPTIAERRGLFIKRTTGTFHLEGVLFHGEDISEGIQLSTPDAHIQIANVAVIDIKARDQVDFSDNHPDLIQSYGGAQSITIDRFTGSTDYQGLFFNVNSQVDEHGPVTLRRVDLVGRPSARYLLWFSIPKPGEAVSLEDVWLDVPELRRGGIGRSVWPDVNGTFPRQAELFQIGGATATRWPEALTPPIRGHVIAGTPPHGHFVDVERIGIGYESPGYVIKAD